MQFLYYCSIKIVVITFNVCRLTIGYLQFTVFSSVRTACLSSLQAYLFCIGLIIPEKMFFCHNAVFPQSSTVAMGILKALPLWLNKFAIANRHWPGKSAFKYTSNQRVSCPIRI